MSSTFYDSSEEFFNVNGEVLNEIYAAENEDQENVVITKYLQNLNLPQVQCFPKGFGTSWFNTKRPLTLKDLQGKVVLLDFFTYCCINCMHILPDLKKLENEFTVENGFVVIGVHSAKFENEKEAKNVRAAIQRYNITHPVITDSNAEYWNYLNISCWPTLYMLNPHGKPIFCFVGEGNREKIRSVIQKTLRYYKNRNEITNNPLPIVNAAVIPEIKNGLSFPGKITNYWSEEKRMIAVSDSSNHRIVIAADSGEIIQIVGTGKAGFHDGALTDAKFNSPQGLVFYDENILYVADTENHAIRKIDLKNRCVSTVTGTGKQGNDFVGKNVGTKQEISSPWDVCLYKTTDWDSKSESDEKRHILLIAMAGTHQIWAYFIDSCVWWKGEKFPRECCAAIAGTGREENRNNCYPHAASFAQPSGLALDETNKRLFIADSESSSIRCLCLKSGRVFGIVGGNASPDNLFDFGDLDGKGTNAKLQHPLGLAYSTDGRLFVADSYNHKIKEIWPDTQMIKTILGNSRPGDDCRSNDTVQFNEPGGLSVAQNGTVLFVADTNNDCIKMINLHGQVNPEKMEFFIGNSKPTSTSPANEFYINASGSQIDLQLKFTLDDNVKLSEHVKQRVDIDPIDMFVITAEDYSPTMNIKISCPAMNHDQEKILVLKMRFITCAENTCSPIYATFNIKVIASVDAPKSITKNISFTISKSGVNILHIE